MKAGIITTPNRQDFLPDMVRLIAPYVDSLKIYNDVEMKGHTYNYRRCMDELLGSAEKDEQVLIATDDMTTIPNWYSYFQDLHLRAKSDIYCLFNRKGHIWSKPRLTYGAVKGVFPGAFYDAATVFINQQGLPGKIREWEKTHMDEELSPKLQKHFDNVIQGYLVYTGTPWVVTVPTLFEHIGDKSSVLGHSVGRSYQYIGNV